MKRAQLRIAAYFLTLLVVAGCGGGEPGAARLAQGGTFRQVLGLEIPNFHPYRDQVAAVYSSLLYDSLVNVTPGKKVVSGLAAKWNATTTSAEFALRDDVTCSDGTPLRPADVANALNHQRDPALAPAAAAALATVPPFTATADDAAKTVTIRMAAPYSFIVRSLGTRPIVCPKGIAEPASFEKVSAGTGPYVLAQYASGGPYRLDVRKGYRWGPDGARTDEPGVPASIILSVVPTPATAANQLIAGDVDAFYTPDPDSVRAPGPEVTKVDVPAVTGMGSFNQRPGRVTGDPLVRKALLAAVDPGQAAAVATGGKGGPARTVMSPAAFCSGDTVSANRPGHDFAEATRLLDQAGWAPGVDGVRVRDGKRLRLKVVTFATSAQLRSTAEFLAGEWKKLGAEAVVEEVTVLAFITVTQQSGDWELALGAGVTGSLPADAAPFFSGPIPPQGRNAGAIDNPEYLRLIGQAASVPDEASCPVWREAEAALVKRADVFAVAETTAIWFARKARFEVAADTTIVPTSIRLTG
ncbi:ABC transporter substrate-binding protein [Amycolatopsis speibonae]|uniref:ABC transporter substrate-binding protein n=1 Tax=Amycolatopsis speibonae TaxID=1450224 RepID=A0ABV7PE94_9PSEU